MITNHPLNVEVLLLGRCTSKSLHSTCNHSKYEAGFDAYDSFFFGFIARDDNEKAELLPQAQQEKPKSVMQIRISSANKKLMKPCQSIYHAITIIIDMRLSKCLLRFWNLQTQKIMLQSWSSVIPLNFQRKDCC